MYTHKDVKELRQAVVDEIVAEMRRLGAADYSFVNMQTAEDRVRTYMMAELKAKDIAQPA